MRQLGDAAPPIVTEIAGELKAALGIRGISMIDASSIVTGRDFLNKIWLLILSVPMGIAIIHEEMSAQTFANIYYEVGLMQAYGKETLVVKTRRAVVPSDFVRTEYVEHDGRFAKRIDQFLDTASDLADHYAQMGDELESNPLLTIDYLRRAYLLSGDETLRETGRRILEEARGRDLPQHSVERLLADF
jgi:hypothetical protein